MPAAVPPTYSRMHAACIEVSRLRTAAWALALAATTLLAPLAARADGEVVNARPVNTRTNVLLELEGDADATASFATSFRALLARIGINLDPASREPLARVRVQIQSGSAACVRLYDARTLEPRLQRCIPGNRPVAVVVEELAHIGSDAVEELAAEAAAASPAIVARPLPRAAPPPAAPPEPKLPNWGFDLGAFAQVHAQGNADPVGAIGGMRLGLAVARSTRQLEIWLSVGYQLPVRANSELVDLKVDALAIRLAPGIRLFGGSGWFLEAAPLVGFDLRLAKPTSRNVPTARLQTPPAQVAWLFGALCTGHVQIALGAELLVGVGAELDAEPQRYVVRSGTERESVFEFARVRPLLLVGLSFTLAGRSPYAQRSR